MGGFTVDRLAEDGTQRAVIDALADKKFICVYLGGNMGGDARIADQTRTLGRLMAQAGIGLVYGGARVGLMGVLADAVLDHGGIVVGVIPRHLQYQEVAHEGLTHLQVVDTMHERKHSMQQLANACIAMPGGFGTLEEMFEALTWAQLEVLDKPCVFLNVDGYHDDLFKFLDHAAAKGLLRAENRAKALQAPTAETALQIVQAAWAAEEAALREALKAYLR